MNSQCWLKKSRFETQNKILFIKSSKSGKTKLCSLEMYTWVVKLYRKVNDHHREQNWLSELGRGGSHDEEVAGVKLKLASNGLFLNQVVERQIFVLWLFVKLWIFGLCTFLFVFVL